MVDLKSSTMRPYFASMSRARRASRALKDIHGETKRYVFTYEKPKRVERKPEFTSSFDAPKKATSNRNRGRVGWEWKINILDQLSEVQGGRCYLCGEVVFDEVPLLAPTHDHVVPKSKGGKRHNNLCMGACGMQSGQGRSLAVAVRADLSGSRERDPQSKIRSIVKMGFTGRIRLVCSDHPCTGNILNPSGVMEFAEGNRRMTPRKDGVARRGAKGVGCLCEILAGGKTPSGPRRCCVELQFVESDHSPCGKLGHRRAPQPIH